MTKLLKKRRPNKIFILVLALSIISSTVFISYRNDFKIVKNLDIYYTLFRELNLFYVDQTDPDKLVKTSIDAMLKSLDPYTTYIPESEQENFKFMTTGKYGGIGALIKRRGEYSIISEPYKDFPAYKAGLIAGDTIMAIDGKSTLNWDITKISNSLKGTPNTPVTVTIKRYGVSETFDVPITREQITINAVPYYGMVSENTAYILLNSFTRGSSKEVKNALKELKSKYNVQSLILDLRNNPGGLLIEAVNIANLFVDKGVEIVNTKGKVKQWEQSYKTTYSATDLDIPVAILVNRSSASASEIVAGSLQDLDRAVIIGERTFGKGLVQTVRPLSYNTQLKVTTAKYYIPSGRCIQALDYSNRNEDGSVGHIPDSLISEFKTKNGRTVVDGGGILPDIKISQEQYDKIISSLYSSNMFFDFATYFNLTYDSIPSVVNFEITDDIYSEFIDFVEKKGFDYKTTSEILLQDLIKGAKKEKNYENAKDELNVLEKKLSHNINSDLKKWRYEISKFLKEEIIGRYYNQQGQIEASLLNNDHINKAVEVLNDKEVYTSILDGTYAVRDSVEIKN